MGTREERDLRAELGEVADIDWRHPSWRGFALGISLLEATGRRTRGNSQMYRSANSDERSDTFMASNVHARGDLALSVARAVVRARVALDVLEELAPRLPDQTLACAMSLTHRWIEPAVLDEREARTAVFVTERGALRGAVTRDGELRLARAMFDWLAGGVAPASTLLTPLDLRARGPVRSAVAVALDARSLEQARHVHRETWARGGGPWLGVCDAPTLEVVSTAHRAVDGYGHALISARLFARTERASAQLARRLRRERPERIRNVPRSLPTPDVGLGFAARSLPNGAGRFAEQAYAMGRTLEHLYRPGDGARFTPTFQVPVAPDARRSELVYHGLLSLRMHAGVVESLEDLRDRLPDWLRRQRDGAGVMTRISEAIANARLPRNVKRRLLSCHYRPNPGRRPVVVLTGRARLSSLRFPIGERPPAPLFAASTPALLADQRDPHGAVGLTLVHHEIGCTASAYGTGLAGTDAGARAFLDRWVDELERADASTRTRPTRAPDPTPSPARNSSG